MVDANILGFVVQKSNMVVVVVVGGGWWVVAGGWWYKPNIGHNSNSTLGGVELTWSWDGVEMEWGVELELDNWVSGLLDLV